MQLPRITGTSCFYVLQQKIRSFVRHFGSGEMKKAIKSRLKDYRAHAQLDADDNVNY